MQKITLKLAISISQSQWHQEQLQKERKLAQTGQQMTDLQQQISIEQQRALQSEIARGSHLYTLSVTIYDRDQNEIKRSRSILVQDQAIKVTFS